MSQKNCTLLTATRPRFQGLPLAVALGLSSMASLLAQAPPMAELDLEELPLGSLVTAEKRTRASLPIRLPDKIVFVAPDDIAVEEKFDNGRNILDGRSLVFRRQSDAGHCSLDFTFPSPGLPAQGTLTLEAELLFTPQQQRGNVMFLFRDQQKDKLFYWQVGTRGSLAASGGGESKETVQIGDLPVEAPAKLKVILDFAKHEASIIVNSIPQGQPLHLDEAQMVTSLSISVNGNSAKRTFAIHSLSISQKLP